MPEQRIWLIHANGGRQLIDPRAFDLGVVAEQARRVGGELVVEAPPSPAPAPPTQANHPPAFRPFEPPASALGPMFLHRLGRFCTCQVGFTVDINTRPTHRVLGGYYKARRLVRVYAVDRHTGRRPLEELFDTFLHEVAHHLEYTEPDTFHARACGRVPGRMHSDLFWRILGELKARWADLQRRA